METVSEICKKGLLWAKDQEYSGYSKGDALLSPLLRKVCGKNRYLQAAFYFIVSRSPVDLRSLIRVKKHLNIKALALFARTYFNLYKITSDDQWLKEGLPLLDSILKFSRTDDYSGHCWGEAYSFQHVKFCIEAYSPRIVVTVEVAQGFIDAYEITDDKKYLDIANSVAEFIANDLNAIEKNEKEICYSYIPKNNWKNINANAKIASFLARLSAKTNDQEIRQNARANMQWVVNRQTDYGAWYYTDPPGDSHIAHDNYHTGFILSSLFEYMNITGDQNWIEAYRRGLDFYEQNLFLPDGAPKWRSNRTYPLDIHGAAQGIINFALASAYVPEKLIVAQNIADWTLKNMYNPQGRFYHQKGLLWTKKITLMRWCQAWMCYALSILSKKQKNCHSNPDKTF